MTSEQTDQTNHTEQADRSEQSDGGEQIQQADDSGLGPMPEPVIEPGEPNPGGVDAQPDDAVGTIPDPPVADNPAVAEKVPDPVMQQVEEGEDTSTRATRSSDGEGEQPEKESPA